MGADQSRGNAPPVSGRLKFLYDWAPVLAFTVVYTVTCVIGAVLLVTRVDAFTSPFEYFTGTAVPDLSGSEIGLLLILLLACPVFLWIGYALGRNTELTEVPGVDSAKRTFSGLQGHPPRWVPYVVFYVLAAAGFASIVRAGSVGDFSSWLDYSRWVDARAQTFRHLGYWEFVNIYLLIPMAAAWVLLTGRRRGITALACRWLPLLLTLIIALLLFQKKTAVVSLLIVLFSWALFTLPYTSPRRIAAAWAAVVLVVVAVYFSAVVVPVLSSPGRVCEGQGQTRCLSGATNTPGVATYALLAPITRTSAPTLYYPRIFPREHAFYGPDVGQDILGMGGSPDDNLVVWRRMNPGDPSGTTAVPFQFTLYSQIGITGALLGSVLMGALLAFLWRAALHPLLPRVWSSMLGSLTLIFAIYLAIDSLRNSTIVSYGVVWGLTFIVGAAALVRLIPGPAMPTQEST